jgi:uncharacterized membrane protein
MRMNKQEFLTTLEQGLDSIAENERKDILYDYEEHFSIGLAEGKSEEEIASALGDARSIARQFNADYHVKQAEDSASVGNIVKAVVATLGLGFFNLVFVLGPFLGLAGIMIGLFAAAIAITIAGVAGTMAIIAAPLFPSLVVDSGIFMNPAGIFFSSIGLIAMGLLFLIGNFYLAKLLYIGTIRYLKLNLRIIKGA